MAKQPVGPIKINWRHPMSRGLISFYVLNSTGVVQDLATESSRGIWNADSIVQTPYGQATRFDGTGEIDLGTNDAARSMKGLRGFTISTRARRATSISNSLPTIFGKTDNTNLGQAYSFYVSEGGNQLRFFNKAAASGFQSSRMGITAPANDTWFVGTASMIRTNDQSFGLMSLDGIQKTISWENASVYQNLSTTTANEYIGSWKPRASSSWDGDIEFVAIWDRGFTEAEHAAFADDPYQITEPLYDYLTPVSKVSAVVALVANDLISLSSVGTPTLGQTHGITANDLSALSSVGSPIIGQTHGLSPESLEALSSIGSPVLGQAHGLTADDLAALSSVGSPLLGQVHGLTASDLIALSSVGSPEIASAIAARVVAMRSGASSATITDGSNSATLNDGSTAATINNGITEA